MSKVFEFGSPEFCITIVVLAIFSGLINVIHKLNQTLDKKNRDGEN